MDRNRVIGRSAVWALAFIFMGALPALAIPVQAPFGDTFSRAIHFTAGSKPTSISYGSGALQNIWRGLGGSKDSGAIMSPVGDGSYVCTAAVFPGVSMQYYFSFRNRDFESDSTGSWLTTAPAAERDQDNNRTRTITVPTTATNGYYFYNAYGDRTVIGFQGKDSTVFSTLNPYIKTIGVTGETPGMARVNTADDTIFANMDGTNTFTMSTLQTGDSAFQISWAFSLGGAEAFVPSVQGATRFSANQTKNSSPQYGFRIWRSDSPAGGINGAVFLDRTTAITQNGDTNWSDNDNNPFNGQSCVDTSWPDTVSTCLYLVTFFDAYGYLQNDTTRQNFGGGYDTAIRRSAVRVFFIVEHYDENVVFPDGSTAGRVYLTPYIDGVRRPDLRQPAMAYKVTRSVTS